ncbi:MAG: hypothetical protein CVU41_12210 [Chloroflexi bacterium HGW-Chloroflexi-3]|nr:MAG: hypothetical protein CVU41_12210 [Chloroflexi bacterium HGW-Chloroflexi-3]
MKIKNRSESWLLLLFILGVLVVLLFKGLNEGWFSSREPLVLEGKPVLMLFNRYKGCECELVVYEAAERQIKNWANEDRGGIEVVIFNLDRRADMKKQFEIVRAPTLILLNAEGEIILNQDEGVSDTEPLNLPLFEIKIKEVLNES